MSPKIDGLYLVSYAIIAATVVVPLCGVAVWLGAETSLVVKVGALTSLAGFGLSCANNAKTVWAGTTWGYFIGGATTLLYMADLDKWLAIILSM